MLGILFCFFCDKREEEERAFVEFISQFRARKFDCGLTLQLSNRGIWLSGAETALFLFQRENLSCLGCCGGYCSVAKLCPTLCYPMDCSTPDFPVLHLQSLLRLMSVELVTLSNHLILYVPLLLPSVFPSIIVVFNELALHVRWPEYWNFSFSISPSNEYSGLISFRIDWFDLLAIQGTLKSLFQHHNLKASVFGT